MQQILKTQTLAKAAAAVVAEEEEEEYSGPPWVSHLQQRVDN